MKWVRNLLRRLLPKPLRVWAWNGIYQIEEWRMFRYDQTRFHKYRLHDLKLATCEQIEGKLTFHAHSIEKGLSHSDIRYGFGRAALTGLRDAMVAYNELGYDKAKKPYQNALSTLREYIEVHETANFEIPYVYAEYGSMADEAKRATSESGGATPVFRVDKSDNRSKNFKDLFKGRYSVREYDSVPVSLRRVKSAISLSTKAPSICNRQSARVHILNDDALIRSALTIQGGLSGYPAPPVLLVITTDTSSFLEMKERNQVYVDGGIFAMALLLSLEYEGLAACSLNAMFTVKQDKAARKLLKLSPSENIIMFISVGNFKKEVMAPKSFRFEADDILQISNS